MLPILDQFGRPIYNSIPVLNRSSIGRVIGAGKLPVRLSNSVVIPPGHTAPVVTPSALLTSMVSAQHFNEASGLYVDSVDSVSWGQSNSPAHVTGKFSRGVQFDGASDQEIKRTLGSGAKAKISFGWWFNRASNLDTMAIGWVDTAGVAVTAFGTSLFIAASDLSANYKTFTDTSSGWTFYTLIYDGSLAAGNRLALYINGSAVTLVAGADPTPATFATGLLSVGNPGGSNGNGIHDEQWIWFDRAITAGDVTALWAGGDGVVYPFTGLP